MADNQYRNDQKTFYSSSPSRHKEEQQQRVRIGLLIPLILIAAVLLFFLVRALLGGGKNKPGTTGAAQSGESTAERSAETKGSQMATLPNMPVVIGTPEETQTVPETLPPQTETPPAQTTAPAQTEPSTAVQPTPPPDTQPFHLYTEEELLPLPEDIDRGLFKDINAADTHGSWWFGSMVRDLSTGQVTAGYDRTAETKALIAKYGGIYRKNEDQKVCYLTFDCGYEYGYTTKILDTLKEKNVKAVFFVTGSFVDDPKNTDILFRMYNEGHMIGSHTDHHKAMPLLTDEDFIKEMNGLQLKVNAMLGFDYQLTYYRPPEGATNERDLCLARKMGYTTVVWSYAYGDYNVNSQPDPAASLEKAKIGLHDGCVYLLHAVSSTNATILGDLIDYMKAEGYDIRRIDQ